MGSEHYYCLPPGALKNQAAIEGAINAFVTVFAVRRLPEQTGDGE